MEFGQHGVTGQNVSQKISNVDLVYNQEKEHVIILHLRTVEKTVLVISWKKESAGIKTVRAVS